MNRFKLAAGTTITITPLLTYIAGRTIDFGAGLAIFFVGAIGGIVLFSFGLTAKDSGY